MVTSQYEQAGVNIEAGEQAVDNIKTIVAATQDTNVLNGIGGFGAEYELTALMGQYHEPVLVSGTDGVGTKLLLAIQAQQHATIGIDLVAMCANDILAQGAKPLFFLDYLGLGQLESDQVTTVVSGIAEGCKQAGLSLIGGEMAEMPGIYHDGDYDLSGFAVGIADKQNLLGSHHVAAGDVLIGLASSGVHSNGFSLVRKIISDAKLDVDHQYEGLSDSLMQTLLTPTILYDKAVRPLIDAGLIHAAANITGGGIIENLARMMPTALTAEVDETTWSTPTIFKLLQRAGYVSQSEMRTVFNMGIGMVLIVSADKAQVVLDKLHQTTVKAQSIGKVVTRHDQPVEYVAH
ncbi:phosphoribosylformylglycinamidine cyclo-ligase [Secundilactobacillus paracollinoides]|uniref:phosphoribosylformylglycinamidine cyclo-ligase n=1 Tax=Secundilactobacillus paracollinoides TaxID=240427 RepID=UPI0012E0F338|nr:phosphoribosylformylglycinamidine cyclo-ligase [Secundilactobacillus paracollinoides]